MGLTEFIFPFFLLPPLWPPSLASFSSTEECLPPPTAMATLPTGTRTDQPQEMLTKSCSWAHHPRCPQRRPTEPGLQLLWKEEEANQLWRKHLPWRSWRGSAWNKVLWRSLWWHPSLWQLLLQQPAF